MRGWWGNEAGLGAAAKFLRDVLLDDGHAVEFFLALFGVRFEVVFAEVRDVFWMGEVFFARVWGGRRESVTLSCRRMKGRDAKTHSRRGISRNDGSRTRTRRRRDGLVLAVHPPY